MVNNNDMNELRRMYINFYDDDKLCIARIIKGIAELSSENTKLKAELQKLKAGPVDKKTK